MDARRYRRFGQHLGCDPPKGHGQSLLQRFGRLPTEYFTQASIIAVAPTHTLRPQKIVALPDPFATILATMSARPSIVTTSSVPRVVRSHDPDKSFHAIIDKSEGACLLAIPYTSISPLSSARTTLRIPPTAVTQQPSRMARDKLIDEPALCNRSLRLKN